MTDDELVLAFRAATGPPFDALFERYREPIWAFFRRRLADPAEAEELAQETFLAVLQGARRYEPRASFRSYLFGIAFNLLSASRRKARPPRRRVVAGSGRVSPAPSPDPAAAIWVRRGARGARSRRPRDRDAARVRRARLPRRSRSSSACPSTPYSSRLFRARLALREKLAGETTHAAKTGVRR